MELIDALAGAQAEFQARLASVKDSDWDRPTPCTDWTVRTLVHHVVAGCHMTVALLGGANADEAKVAAGSSQLGDDPMGNFIGAAEAQDAAFHEPGALERTVHHRVGDMPGTQLLEFRLDPDLVAAVFACMEPMAPMIGQTGQFGGGPSAAFAGDATLQDRLLDLSGRRP